MYFRILKLDKTSFIPMGQLFNRISRFAKTYINDTLNGSDSAERIISSDDDELKRIIDELNSNKNETKSKKSESNRYRTTTQNIKHPLQKEFLELGLNSDASIDEIKSQYKKLVKAFHPDSLKDKSEETQKEADTKMARINEAYSKIKHYKGF